MGIKGVKGHPAHKAKMNQSLNTLLLVVLLGKRLGNNNSAVKKLGSGLKQEEELIKRRNVKKWKNIFEL